MTTSVSKLMIEAGQKARAASRRMAAASTADKNKALLRLAELLEAKKEDIFAANEQDLVKAKENGLKESFVDRLRVTEKVLGLMAEGARQTEALPDPVGEISEMRRRPSGIQVGRMRVPLGVLGIIYESRPNVTVDAACLAVKSGNACILRGGSEAFETNRILGELVQQALTETGLPTEAVQIAPTTDRDFVGEMIRANKYVDVIIPRGGKGLIARLAAEATVPMIHHLDGICHTYVDKDADIDMAVSVTDNAKTQRYSPCNATETLLVHEAVADVFLPRIGRIFAEKNVEMRCDAKSKAVLEASGLSCVDADPSDWDTEYNAPIISIAVVKSLDEAIAFIEEHSSKHTDAIITNNLQASQRFLREVDSGSVMVNCSTRLPMALNMGSERRSASARENCMPVDRWGLKV